jgi:hypothetical protein
LNVVDEKGKATPEKQSVKVHRVVRRRGSNIFQKIDSQMAVVLSALRTGSPSSPKKIPGTHFC